MTLASATTLVFALSWFKLSSLDIGYHVAYGRHFLDTGRIVGFEPDPFLLPQTGIPFVNANWGSQVIMALAERAGGSAGLTALRTLLVVMVFGGIALAVRTVTKNPVILAIGWMLAALGAYERFSMRPELFSYAVMALQFAILRKGVRTLRSIAAVTLLQVAWVNLHSYFAVGVMLCGAFWLESGWRRLRHGPSVEATNVERVPQFRRASLLLMLSIGACAAHPWGYRAALFPLRTLEFLHQHEVMGNAPGDAGTSAMAEISEFKSPFEFSGERINHRTIQAYYLLLVLAAVCIPLLIRRGAIGSAVVLLILIAMSTQMRRNIAQFAIIAGPISAVVMGTILASLRIRGDAGPRRGRAFGAVIITVLCAALAVEAVSGRTYFSERRVTREFGFGYSHRTFSENAVRWLDAHTEVKPNLYVDYFWSSNTLLWLSPRFRLFVDTNTFAYDDATLQTTWDLEKGMITHGPFMDQFSINVILLGAGPRTQQLIGALRRDEGTWALAYADATAVIFLRRIPAHVQTILDNPVTARRAKMADWIASVKGPSAARALALGTMVSVPISLGWWEEAAELCEEALRAEPAYEEAWINLGLCKGNLAKMAARAGQIGDAVTLTKRAIDCFQRAVEIDPKNSVAVENLRRAKVSLGGR